MEEIQPPKDKNEPQEPREETCESALQSEVLGDDYYAGHGHWPFASGGDDEA